LASWQEKVQEILGQDYKEALLIPEENREE
jgi:hypothetical protein